MSAPKSAHTPIIFVTGSQEWEDIERAYSLGAVDFISIPIVPYVLRAKVAVFVYLYQSAELAKKEAEACTRIELEDSFVLSPILNGDRCYRAVRVFDSRIYRFSHFSTQPSAASRAFVSPQSTIANTMKAAPVDSGWVNRRFFHGMTSCSRQMHFCTDPLSGTLQNQANFALLKKLMTDCLPDHWHRFCDAHRNRHPEASAPDFLHSGHFR